MKKCPFCGKDLEKEPEDDYIHKNGIIWVDRGKFLSFHSFRDPLKPELLKLPNGQCWEINCATDIGGCGARMTGLSKEDVLRKWDRRAGL